MAIHKIGIIGTGAIAEKHALAISEIEQSEIVAVCSSSPERAKIAEEKFGVKAYSNVAAFLSHPGLTIVCICTASGSHLEAGISAAKAGKHLLVEKPIEINLSRTDQLIDACHQNEVLLNVVFQNRFSPGYIKLKNAVKEGLFGRLIMGNAHINWYRSADYYSGSDWKGTIQYDGGGALINQGIHTIDLLLDIMGEPTSVFAKVKTTLHAIEGEDLAAALVSFKGKALGNITASTALFPGLPERLEIFGVKGSAVLEAGELIHWKVKQEEEQETKFLKTSQIGSSDPMAIGHSLHKSQWMDFLNALNTGSCGMVDGHAARRSVELIRGIYKSSETGKEVTFPIID